MTTTLEAPTLETPRLLLRPMLPTDVNALLVIFADSKVMAAFDADPFDCEQMTAWVQRNLDHQAEHGYGLFSIILKTNGELIGDCGLEHMDVKGVAAAELGYDFRSDYWNGGYATEAATTVRNYAFDVLQLPRLISLIRQHNLASQRVAEKVGMRRTDEVLRGETRYWVYTGTRGVVAKA